MNFEKIDKEEKLISKINSKISELEKNLSSNHQEIYLLKQRLSMHKNILINLKLQNLKYEN
jgi:hypothetical protein